MGKLWTWILLGLAAVAIWWLWLTRQQPRRNALSDFADAIDAGGDLFKRFIGARVDEVPYQVAQGERGHTAHSDLGPDDLMPYAPKTDIEIGIPAWGDGPLPSPGDDEHGSGGGFSW